ncbi:MAG TPA: hypothetical protein VMM77_05845, partial [Gemmatimonadaceae bacterium]|nr:hypothetical protein [Gemmatimonadaceae bacterium]
GSRTPEGHAVRCGAGNYCFFFRPGPVLRAVPMTTSANVVLWGLGVEGLSVHATGRLLADFGRDEVWPGTDPAVQLLEGYVAYERSFVKARAGRQLISSRLEPMGFDGGWMRARWDDAALEFTGYGGWGLGQASALSVLSPALNPLDEWRPRDRQLVAGAEAAWLYRDVDVRAEYRREIDPQDDYFVSERTALSLGARTGAFRAAGGLDYNLAEGHLGSADATLTYLHSRYSVSAGARRYRPYFSLWTLWSAFSPVPYHAVNLSGEVRATDRLSLHARAERYRYEDADVSTALVSHLEDRGWRANAGAHAALSARWRVSGNVGLEHGPGASGRFADGAVSWVPNERYAFDVYGGTMARPLELRFYDATSRWIGSRAEWRFSAQRRVWGDIAFVDDERDRPDASASSLNQFRARAGVSLIFGTAADRTPLPPARRTGQ